MTKVGRGEANVDPEIFLLGAGLLAGCRSAHFNDGQVAGNKPSSLNSLVCGYRDTNGKSEFERLSQCVMNFCTDRFFLVTKICHCNTVLLMKFPVLMFS